MRQRHSTCGRELLANCLDFVVESANANAKRFGDLTTYPVVIGVTLAGECLDQGLFICGLSAFFSAALFLRASSDCLENLVSQSSAFAPPSFSAASRFLPK